jgi:hypothetical protein
MVHVRVVANEQPHHIAEAPAWAFHRQVPTRKAARTKACAPVRSNGQWRENGRREIDVAALVNQLLHLQWCQFKDDSRSCTKGSKVSISFRERLVYREYIIQRNRIQQQVAPETQAVALVAQADLRAASTHGGHLQR